MRTPCSDKSGLKKGTWTPEEDSKLIAYVTRYGCWNWRQLPRFAGLARCGKSCRLRWLNYLRPNIKRGNYTKEEDDIIIKLQQQLGNKWSAIAAELPGRTDNEIKNHWHTNLKNKEMDPMPSGDHSQGIPDHGKSSSESSTAEFLGITSETTVTSSNESLAVENAFLEPMSGNFWTDPYIADFDISYDVPTELLSLPPHGTEPQYFSSVCNAQLWSHNNLYDQYSGFF